jgi:two-component system NtrC family sensor kinase
MNSSIQRASVLVVDDEEAVCRALDLLLYRAGYDVITARSGAAAKEILAGREIDCLVMDYRIPDLRGDVVFAYAIAHQPHLARATVFVTGDITDRAREAIEDTGCPMVLKPFDAGALLDRVAEQLAGGRR